MVYRRPAIFNFNPLPIRITTQSAWTIPPKRRPVPRWLCQRKCNIQRASGPLQRLTMRNANEFRQSEACKAIALRHDDAYIGSKTQDCVGQL